jgi:hypothetical protein
MPSPDARQPPLHGRGVLLASEFCQATGLDEATVAGLVASGSIEGLFDQQGRLMGVFDDGLPSASSLRARGLVVHGAYDPQLLRSYEVEDPADEEDDRGDVGPSWSMRWPE